MNKEQFLDQLRQHLKNLPPAEVEEIVRDQNEYIEDARASGRSEEEIIRSLGDPKNFATNLTVETKIEKAEQSPGIDKKFQRTLNAVVAALALAPLNLLIVLGPFLVLCGLTIAGWAVAFSGVLLAIVGFLLFFIKLIFLPAGIFAHLSAFFFIAGSFGLFLLFLILMYQATHWFMSGTLSYLKWNIHFIKGRS